MLLGFDDGVYDFNEKCFRAGTPEDMITLSVGHSMRDVQERDPVICVEIMRVLGSMHESDVRDYVIRKLATSVFGDRVNDHFYIWTGSGGNGKGLSKNLAAAAFGGYYYEPDQALFVTRSASISFLSSEMAQMKGKRLIITSEAEPSKDKLRVGLLKECSGHDLIQARNLYMSASTFRPMFNII
jgi:phage/plasmid-associated DNA primase